MCIRDRRYTIVSVNLFFHGKSFSEKGVFKPGFSEKDLNGLFERFLLEFKATRFSLMGYSLGGRVVLQLAINYAERINRVFLLAPDGLKISRWYRFVTHWRIGRRIFKRIVRNPKRFFSVAGFFHKLRLVGTKQYKFALSNFDTPVSYTHLRAHETVLDLVCRLLLDKKNKRKNKKTHMCNV